MIRLAQTEDIPRIAEINIAGWRHAYIDIVPNEFLFKELSVLKTVKKLEENFMSEKIRYVYEDDKDKIIKGMCIAGNCRDDDTVEGFELMAIYIEPAFIRCGIGTEFIKHFEKTAQMQNKRELYIWCLEKNRNARAFYEKFGYKLDGKTKMLDKIKALEVRYKKILNL
ncbi:GNAT family N-acetyltransferase [Treponema pedis]|uniref:GNAT family N-acetyltransferase n=1 Tax=Treponema pedis TaxID=409322 RepID=UPI00042602E6|nr:GNAT family N-acetyltransferase [Treponema pedis]QSI05143.1 GNAT family N-acetyltransferase [Treponema pedis]